MAAPVRIERFNPTSVVAGHKPPGTSDQPRLVGETLKAQDEDREQRYLGKPPKTLKAVSDDPTELFAMAGPAAYDYFMEQQRIAPNWKNELTLRSMDFYRSVENSVFTP